MLKFNQFVEEIAQLSEEISKMSGNSQAWYQKGYEMGKNPSTYKSPPYGIGGAAMDAFRKGRKAGEEAAKKKNEEVELDEAQWGADNPYKKYKNDPERLRRMLKKNQDAAANMRNRISKFMGSSPQGLKDELKDIENRVKQIKDVMREEVELDEGKDGVDQHPEVRKRYDAMRKTKPDTDERKRAVRAFMNKKKELRRENEEVELDEEEQLDEVIGTIKKGIKKVSDKIAAMRGKDDKKPSGPDVNKGLGGVTDEMLKRNTYLRYNEKQLEPMIKNVIKDQRENEMMYIGSKQHRAKTGRWLPGHSPEDYEKRKKKIYNKAKKLKAALEAAKARKASAQKRESYELDEISKKTLGSYVKKAGASMASHGVAVGSGRNTEKSSRAMANRMKGMNRAADRLSKEEVELDEANKGTTPARYDMIKRAVEKLRGDGDSKAARRDAKRAMKSKDAQRGMAPVKTEARLDEISPKLARKAAAASAAKSFEYGSSAYDDESQKNADRLDKKSDKAYAHVMKRQGQKGINKTNRLAGKLIYGKSRYMESAEELEEGRNEALKALEKLASSGGIDKADFQKAHDLYKANKLMDLRKHIYRLDTDPSEAIASVIDRHDSKAFNSMYPRAKSGDYIRKIVLDHGGK